MEGSNTEIAFEIYYEDTITPLNFDCEKTINELKEFICLCLECQNPENLSLFLENYGQLDNEELLEFPLSLIELKSKKEHTYKLFCINKTQLEQNIKYNTFCTQKLFTINTNYNILPLRQIGLKINKSYMVCLACARNCHQNIFNSCGPEDLIFSNFVCQCSQIKNNNNSICKYNSCELLNLYTNSQITDVQKKNQLMKCIKILSDLSSKKNLETEKLKKQESTNKILMRDFDFEPSISSEQQKIKNYQDPITQQKILSIIPKRPENSTDEEYIKILLHWFKHEFFSWCDRPKCPKCNSNSQVQTVGTSGPNQMEQCFQCSRTEVYCCKNCQNCEVRFPRYNNPIKLIETKTGRCGEWSNMFGCVLFACGFKTRLIHNFEDHVWNEYYDESKKRWIHLDPCEEQYDKPLVYDQGWGRVMTFVIACSKEEISDVTMRYVKDWEDCKKRRSEVMCQVLRRILNEKNQIIRRCLSDEEIKKLDEREKSEKEEFDKKLEKDKEKLTGNFVEKLKSMFGGVDEEEKVPRQSGSLEWRKDRGEI